MANVILFQEVVLHIPELGPSYPGHDLLSGRFVKFPARANVPYRAFRGRFARAVNFTKPPPGCIPVDAEKSGGRLFKGFVAT